MLNSIQKWIESILLKRINQKKQDIVRLRWQKAELQKTLDELKKQQAETDQQHNQSK